MKGVALTIAAGLAWAIRCRALYPEQPHRLSAQGQHDVAGGARHDKLGGLALVGRFPSIGFQCRGPSFRRSCRRHCAHWIVRMVNLLVFLGVVRFDGRRFGRVMEALEPDMGATRRGS